MKRLGHIFATLAFAFALLMGMAGGAMAHAEAHPGAMDHHGTQHAPSAPTHGASHKAALVIVAPCCPAAEAPAQHGASIPERVVEASWHPRPSNAPNARDITPDTPPPKSSL
ncbi:hypothetical protein [Azospirillum soli]|uniref:hypothetical protein n=1 Tax=Azospirillum soli TaxID=1304799 RepID=UPI001AE42B69|nr:hypothetical protein [Azospirillum soli]MBP2312505.1 hypothetical protein [Azospirillum soli]